MPTFWGKLPLRHSLVVVVILQAELNHSLYNILDIQKSDITNSDDHPVHVIFSEFGLMCESGRLDAKGSR